MTIFRAGEPTVETIEIRFLPGDERAGDCYVVDGRGVSHETLMKEPYVGALAAALTDRLDPASGAAAAQWREVHSAGAC